jgi:hypothetical protein
MYNFEKLDAMKRILYFRRDTSQKCEINEKNTKTRTNVFTPHLR